MIDYQYFEGGLTDAPEVRYTPNGNAVTTMTLAQSDSKKNDAGEWETTANRYLRVSLWDNDRHTWSDAFTKLDKGTKLVVRGKLVTRKWEDKDGNTRSQLEVQAVHAYVEATSTGTQQQGSAHTQTTTSGNNTTETGNTQVNTSAQPTGWMAQDQRGGFANNDQPPF